MKAKATARLPRGDRATRPAQGLACACGAAGGRSGSRSPQAMELPAFREVAAVMSYFDYLGN